MRMRHIATVEYHASAVYTMLSFTTFSWPQAMLFHSPSLQNYVVYAGM